MYKFLPLLISLFFCCATLSAQFAPVILPCAEEEYEQKPDSCFVGVVMKIVFVYPDDTLRPSDSVAYTWLKKGEYELAQSVAKQIPTPDCYRRVPVTTGSFAEWLRFLPLEPEGTKLLLFNGKEKNCQDDAHRLLRIDVGTEDLQQCADAAMRLVCEYHYSRQQYDKIYFNFTSGHKVSFEDWRWGKRAKVSGNRRVYFTPKIDTVDNSRQNLTEYFSTLFRFAGSYSLSRELKPKPLSELQAGDVFVRGGFPGHVIMVIDVAQHEITGEKIFLLSQGAMPAQHIHIFYNINNTDRSPWHSLHFGDCLYIPDYDFERTQLYSIER